MPIIPEIVDVSALDTGINAVLLSGTTTGTWVECKRVSQVVFELDVVNTTGIALPIVMYFETQRDGETVGVARREVAMVNATMGSGLVYGDFYAHPWRFNTPAAALTYYFSYGPINIAAHRLRLSGITAAGSGAGDLLTVRYRLVFP
jgi:hypothetical protein